MERFLQPCPGFWGESIKKKGEKKGKTHGIRAIKNYITERAGPGFMSVDLNGRNRRILRPRRLLRRGKFINIIQKIIKNAPETALGEFEPPFG